MSSDLAATFVLDQPLMPAGDAGGAGLPDSSAKRAIVRPTVRPRDPLKALASLIAESLMDKLGEEKSQLLLRGLFGPSTEHRKRGLSISRLIDLYLEHADSYYLHPDGTPTGEASSIRYALKVLRKMFGRTRVEDFRPLRLKAVRDEMIAKGWCRKTVNEQISRIKRMYKWGVENELMPADRYHALQAVSGLKLGRTAAAESEPVKPAPEPLIEAVLPLVSAQVAAMIRLQLLTGMRPGEVLIMRTCDIDRSGEIWVYSPMHHKTAHHHHIRQVFLGPKAQQVITPFLKPDQPEVYIFSAAEADQESRRQRHEARVTPLHWGNSPGTHRKRRPKCHPGGKYRRDSYTRAISRACRQAFPVPEGLSPEDAEKWRREHHWHPHQLRHNAATRVRKLFGIDAAGNILGHKTLAITAIYAEKNTEEAIAIMKQIG